MSRGRRGRRAPAPRPSQASRAGEAHPALPGHPASPRRGLTCAPQPALALTAPAPSSPACSLREQREDRGPPRARRRCFSFKKKPFASASGGYRPDLEGEARGLRLRAGRPAQSLAGIVVSPGLVGRCQGVYCRRSCWHLCLSTATKQTSCSIRHPKPTRALSEPLGHLPAAAHNPLPSTFLREVA